MLGQVTKKYHILDSSSTHLHTGLALCPLVDKVCRDSDGQFAPELRPLKAGQSVPLAVSADENVKLVLV